MRFFFGCLFGLPYLYIMTKQTAPQFNEAMAWAASLKPGQLTNAISAACAEYVKAAAAAGVDPQTARRLMLSADGLELIAKQAAKKL